MIRSKLRDLAYAWSRTTAFSVTQTQMDDFLVIAAQDFARDAGGLQESLTIMPSGAERSFDLPEGTQDVFSVYYDDEIEGELIEAPDVRVLADPDYRAGTLSTFPTSYAVQAGRPPVIWLDAVPDAGKDLRLIVFKNSIGWADGDDEEPELSSSYQVAIAFKAAAYAAMTQFDESVRLLRETEYKAKVDRYVEERGRKQSTAARLRAPPRLSRSGEWGGGGGLLGILAEGESEMGVTLDQVYTFLKTILESSSEARLRISANDVTKRIEFQPASTTGLNETEVDTRVAAGVEGWAEANSADTIPVDKIPADIARDAEVDKSIVDGVADWARLPDESIRIPTDKLLPVYSSGMIWGIWNAAITPGFQSFANTYEFGSSNFGTYQSSARPSVSAATRYLYIHVPIIEPDIEQWTTEGGSDQFAELVKQGSTHVYNGTTYKWWRSRNKIALSIILNGKRWRFYNLKDELTAKEVLEVDARVAAKVEDWAEDSNTDLIPSTKLPAPVGIDQAAVDARVKAGVEDWAETSNDDPIPATKLTNAPSGGGVSGGLNQAAVDVRVAAGVQDWAETSDTTVIPKAKLPTPVVPGLDQSAVDARVVAGVESWAAEGDVTVIPTTKLPAPVVPGLDQSAVDARVAAKVEDWAEDGNADLIPAKKLTNAPSGSGGGLNQAAVDARVVAGVESWAAEGDVEVIPTDKLPAPVVPGLNQAAVDARVVAGVESWAAEGDTDVIPTAKLPTPGLDQAAVDARVAAGVEDWAEDGNPSVVPAAKLPAALAATASSHTDVVTWTHTSDFSPNTLYHTAIEVDASMAFMHIALNVSGTSTPRELGFMRIRTAEWLALTEDNTLSGGSFTENNVRSGILAYATDDRFNVISLHLRRYTDAGKSLMSVGIKVLTSDTPAADINGIRYFYEHPGTVGSGGGLNQAAVDARVVAGVESWAAEGDTEVIPTAKLPAPVVPGLNQAAVDARVVAGVESWAAEGDTEVIPTAKLPAPVVPGLNQAAVDARVVAGVESWAAEGDTEVIPTAKLPAPVVPGLNQAAVDARVVAGVESWAAEGDTDLIPSTKLPAPVGIDQSAVDARVAAKVEDWAEDSNTDTIPLAKLPTLASPYTDSVSLTFTGDLTVGLLYRTAIEVDMTKDFMHIALSVSGTSTPRELEYARIRTDEWLALAVDTTADAGTFVESDGKSGVLAYATDDRFNVIALHLRRYVVGGKSLLSIGIRAASADTPAADINGIRYFYETAGTAAGISTKSVGDLVKAGIQDWAETDNVDRIPDVKLPLSAVSSSEITILGPRHTLVKADYLASKTLWNGQELVPITREVTDAHNAIYRFAAIDSTPGSGSIGKEIISLTFNYAVMRSSFNQNLTRSWTWVAGQAVAVGDMSYTDPSGSLKHHRCIRSHTTSTSGADGPPDSANQTGWQPYSLRSIANKANYLGVYNTSGEVASASLADGKWIITTAGQFVIAQIYNGGGWSSYIIPSIGSFNGTNFADHDAAGNAVQYYNASQPDYFMVNDIVNILTFLIPADAGVEGFHGTAPEKRDPVIVLWGRGQSSRLGNDDANGPATNAEGDVFPGGSVSGAFQRLRWKDNPSESYFGANRGMFRTVSPGFSALTGIDHRPDPFPSGHAFQLAPGLWSFRCWIDVPWLPESFPSVRIIKMRTGGTDYVLGSSQAAASHTLDSQVGTPDQNYVSSSEALYIDIGQNDILYVIVVGFSTNQNVGKFPFQHMFCWYHG